MIIERKDSRIFFKYKDKAYASIGLDTTNEKVTIDIIKVLPSFRKNGIATMIIKKILEYVSLFLTKVKTIVLSPLPLDSDGLNLEQLINFYKKFGFNPCPTTDISTPYLMSKNV